LFSQLSNCPKCGKLFLKIRPICDECYQKQEEDFRKVSSHLWDYPGSNIQELSEATEVSVAQIRQFILAGRILMGQFVNLTYPCDNCGRMIKEGKTCSHCLENIKELAIKVEKEIQSDKSEKTSSYKIYRDK
jgi:uncharacterized protein